MALSPASFPVSYLSHDVLTATVPALRVPSGAAAATPKITKLSGNDADQQAAARKLGLFPFPALSRAPLWGHQLL